MKRSELQLLDAHISKRISELQTFLESDASSAGNKLAANSNPEPDAGADRQIAEMKKQELARLRANLQWLDSGNGGCCEQCGGAIPMARLRAVPVTRLCVSCAR